MIKQIAAIRTTPPIPKFDPILTQPVSQSTHEAAETTLIDTYGTSVSETKIYPSALNAQALSPGAWWEQCVVNRNERDLVCGIKSQGGR